MKIIYNDINITNDVKINRASITDNCGGRADKIQCIFSDINKNWRNWSPKKGDTLVLVNDKFSSGKMFIDELYISRGIYKINAISTPLNSKIAKSRVWESITFKSLVNDLANEVGLTVETYYINDWIYERIDQMDETNLEFLNRICILEGYNLKITDGKVVIYDERTLESSTEVLKVTEKDILGDYDFKVISSGLYSSSSLEYLTHKNEFIRYSFTPTNPILGPILKLKNIKVSSYAEAERFTKNLLRYNNKYETSGSFAIKANSEIGAGNVIKIEDLGSFNGKYFIDKVIYNTTNNQSNLQVRKVLEGY